MANLFSDRMKNLAATLAPEYVAKAAAKKKFKNIKIDENNFSNPQQLSTFVSPYRMISFDLFDTLVWRKVSLQDIHAKTSDFADRFIRGDDGPLPHGLLLNSRQKHQETLKTAKMVAGKDYRDEVDIQEVFDTALAPYISDSGARDRAVQSLISYEIKTECEVLTVDPKMRKFLEELRKQDKVLILVSDMYFSEIRIRKILEHLDLLRYFDHIFVSASVGLTKHSGKIFAHVDELLGSSSWPRLHLGDNWRSDVVQPRSLGWDALHYLNVENETRKNKLELLTRFDAYSRSPAHKKLLAELLGAKPEERLFRLISAGFYSFARQVLATAQQERFDRILFLSRDGTIYHHLVKQMIEETGAKDTLDVPSMEDLAFSRRMGVLLTCPSSTQPQWENYLRQNIHWLRNEGASLASIMRTFALSNEDMAPSRGIDKWVDAYLDGRTDCDVDFSEIVKNPNLATAIDGILQTKRQRVIDYLDQKNLFLPNQRVLLVDIGYSGTVLKSLSDHMYALESQGQKLGTRFVMMMFANNRYFSGNLGQMHPRISMLRSLFLGQRNWRQRAVSVNFAWLEPFAVDRTRGSLKDFQADNTGKMHPIFDTVGPSRGPISRENILENSRAISGILRHSSILGIDAEKIIGRAILDRFSMPRRDTLNAVKGLTHQAGLTDINENGLLGRIRLRRLRGDVARCIRDDRWVQGSMASSCLGWLNPLLNAFIGAITR